MFAYSFRNPAFVGALGNAAPPTGAQQHGYAFTAAGSTDDETDTVGSNDLEVTAGNWFQQGGTIRYPDSAASILQTKSAESMFRNSLGAHFSIEVVAEFSDSLPLGNSESFVIWGDVNNVETYSSYLYYAKDPIDANIHKIGWKLPAAVSPLVCTKNVWSLNQFTITAVWNADDGKFYLDVDGTTVEYDYGTTTEFPGAGGTSKFRCQCPNGDLTALIDSIAIYDSALL